MMIHGEIVDDSRVALTMVALLDLCRRCPSYVFDLVELCRRPGHPLLPEVLLELQAVMLVEEDGTMNRETRHVVLNAVSVWLHEPSVRGWAPHGLSEDDARTRAERYARAGQGDGEAIAKGWISPELEVSTRGRIVRGEEAHALAALYLVRAGWSVTPPPTKSCGVCAACLATKG